MCVRVCMGGQMEQNQFDATLIQPEQLSNEAALSLRVFCSALKQRGEELDEIVPDLCTLSDLIEGASACFAGAGGEEGDHWWEQLLCGKGG